ncbi:sugar transporter [Niastella koreensis]|uniref:Polysaccharide export protein n=2 Tax=Niastella koreensis TaxID=354356 RepID=G8TRZ7_NIAKG|nr:polysaccharide biosynthesis/export family protein [Niastella koreensis]AEW03332.1 polysaccharide export protein [Niastella koreensis GR20-10]OQP55616.1 sugar transporter [Niastella koreensis]
MNSENIQKENRVTQPNCFYSTALAVLVCSLLLSSCASTKSVVYLKDAKDSEVSIYDKLEPVIQRNDLLSITVSSPNAIASQPFNTAISVSTQLVGYTSTQAYGYLVDQDGYIDIPMLGRIKAAGLTKKELKDKITDLLVDNKFLMQPVVSVRYLNFKVTVLGEVARPMVINAPDEKINILEALGFAGDMTVYAKRDNVVLIREEGGKRITKRLNLNNDEILKSPYYNLKTNDIVYVEPNKTKVNANGNAKTWLPAVLAALSLSVVMVDHITRN